MSPIDDVIMISLGQSMADTDNNQYSHSRRVNINIWDEVPDFDRKLST